jgi:hypothetical protein
MSGQKGLVQRIERKLEVTVGDAFARVFGGSIVPQELEAMLRREAGEGIRPVAGNHLLAPNEYIITLGMHDYQKVGADPDLTSDAFAKHLAGYIGEQGWQTYGDVVVRFEQSANLHTGQFRTRGAVNPDVEPRATAGELAPPQSDRAFSAEPGVRAMTENSSYRGGPGQGRPGDEYYDEAHAHPQDDPHAAPEPRAPYPPESGGYGEQRGGYPEQGGYPKHGGYDQRGGYPEQGGYDQRGGYPEQRGGYPEQAGYDQRGAAPGYDQPGYDQRGGYGQGGYDPRGGYPDPRSAGPAADPGYRPAGYGQPGGGPGPGEYGEYGRGPGRHEEAAGYGPPEQRGGGYDQGGYDQGYGGGQGYGRQDYGQQPEYGRYGEAPGQNYAPPAGGGYAEPGRDYDYGQPAEAGGYGQSGYGQGGYSSSGSAVTLQLDDGSGRTYQLREGANVIGRGQDAQFRLPDTGVSRRHLEIRWDGQVALLSDLNSTNGTTVNNAPVQEWQLADGDVIRLGHSEIVVHIH